jgi:site-specific recombinase XerD
MLKPKSPRIKFASAEKVREVNPETLRLWEKFEIDMNIRELSTATVRGYRNDLEHLWLYTYDHFDNIPISELTEDELTEFFYYCKMQGNNAKRIKRRMASISSFYKFLRKRKIIKEDPMEFVDRPKKDTSVLTQNFLNKEQVLTIKTILKQRYEESKTLTAQHRAISYLVYATLSLSTMARVNAVCNIKWKQIDFDQRIVTDVLEKEGKIVTLYFSKEVAGYLKELKRFRRQNGIDDGGFLFVTKTQDGYRHVSKTTLNQWARKIGSIIGLSTLHPHDFRHTQATLLKDAGMPLEDISALLNHESTETTNQFYIKKNDKNIVLQKDKFEDGV